MASINLDRAPLSGRRWYYRHIQMILGEGKDIFQLFIYMLEKGIASGKEIH